MRKTGTEFNAIRWGLLSYSNSSAAYIDLYWNHTSKFQLDVIQRKWLNEIDNLHLNDVNIIVEDPSS